MVIIVYNPAITTIFSTIFITFIQNNYMKNKLKLLKKHFIGCNGNNAVLLAVPASTLRFVPRVVGLHTPIKKSILGLSESLTWGYRL